MKVSQHDSTIDWEKVTNHHLSVGLHAALDIQLKLDQEKRVIDRTCWVNIYIFNQCKPIGSLLMTVTEFEKITGIDVCQNLYPITITKNYEKI